jgi:hypothetical protein
MGNKVGCHLLLRGWRCEGMYDSIHQALNSGRLQFTSTCAFSFDCKFMIRGALMYESSMHVWDCVSVHVSSL